MLRETRSRLVALHRRMTSPYLLDVARSQIRLYRALLAELDEHCMDGVGIPEDVFYRVLEKWLGPDWVKVLQRARSTGGTP